MFDMVLNSPKQYLFYIQTITYIHLAYKLSSRNILSTNWSFLTTLLLHQALVDKKQSIFNLSHFYDVSKSLLRATELLPN